MTDNITSLINAFARSNTTDEVRKNLFKIDSATVFDDCYRVNVWTRTMTENRVVPSFNIADSFLVELVDGKIVDRTIR